ncbi:hypothetical protein O6H91_17G004100 [Diphasiastrum complanatum]|uniref:Uncharacterized protein n=1 Tax=Diphasiastrum complanatum TaxID=34168 RepID=A0ACC2B3W4_DIPCM|nr:hypothetical protein O6H91_17G004100 [Diphasiastrum complanatum]
MKRNGQFEINLFSCISVSSTTPRERERERAREQRERETHTQRGSESGREGAMTSKAGGLEPWPSLLKYSNAAVVLTKSASSPKRKGNKASGEPKSLATQQTEDILDAILPPRQWVEDGQQWVQHVSSTPATRLDVVNLQEKLDQELQRRQARETGICPIREELYAQCFDELIRQVTVNCAERGLLLLRVRDELRMTIAAYQTLYESSVAFGLRKALQAECGKENMETRIQQLEGELKELDRQVAEWKFHFVIKAHVLS